MRLKPIHQRPQERQSLESQLRQSSQSLLGRQPPESHMLNQANAENHWDRHLKLVVNVPFSHWFIDSLIHSLINSFIDSLIHWFIDSLIHSLILTFILSYIYSYRVLESIGPQWAHQPGCTMHDSRRWKPMLFRLRTTTNERIDTSCCWHGLSPIQGGSPIGCLFNFERPPAWMHDAWQQAGTSFIHIECWSQ